MKTMLCIVSIALLALVAQGQTVLPWDVQAKICKLPDNKNYTAFPECKLNCTTYKVKGTVGPTKECLNIPGPVDTSFTLECLGYQSCVASKAWKGNNCDGAPTAKQHVYCGVCDDEDGRGQINMCNASGVTVHLGCEKKTCAGCTHEIFVPANTCWNPLQSQGKKLELHHKKNGRFSDPAPSVAPASHSNSSSAPISIDERIEVGTTQAPCNYVNVTHYYGQGCSGSIGSGANYQLATDVCDDEIGLGYVVEYSCLIPSSKEAQKLPVAPAHVMQLIGKHLKAKANRK